MAKSRVTRRGMIGGIAAGAGAAAAATGIGAAPAQSAPKTFVLVHGTFAGGWYWRRVSDLLEKHGHKVFSSTLSGLGERSHLVSKEINLDTHITDVVNVFKWEDLTDACLVVHSYGGWIGSGVVEQIGDRLSSIVWLDAFKPENGQRPIDFTNEGFRKLIMGAADKNEASFAPPPKLPPVFVNEKDRDYVDSKLTPQPINTYFQPVKLSDARDRIAKKTYIRATKFPSPAFDKALAECRADKSWTAIDTNAYHIVMLDEPQWLADTLVNAA
jgi:pimeloyl-ACP methyl ester carboxylesterase